MARIGMKKPMFCPITEANGAETLGSKITIGRAMSADVQIRVAEAKLYADDELAESSKEFTGGTVTIGVDDIEDTALSVICGHKITEGTLVGNKEDNAPYGRLSWIVPKKKNDQPKFRVICLMKVKFGIPSERSESKGETITFGTESIQADISTNATGDWKKEQTFDTLEEAVTYQESLMTT